MLDHAQLSVQPLDAAVGAQVTGVDLSEPPDAETAAAITEALDDLGVARDTAGLPMRASEDFGQFGHHAGTAMFLLGAGEGCASLHNPDYDFPDALIPTGVAIFDRIRAGLLGLVPAPAN